MTTRREFLTGGAAALVTSGLWQWPTADAAPAAAFDVVTPEQPKYTQLAGRGYSRRFRAKPHEILVPHNSSGVVSAVQCAVDRTAHIGIRSGGHCFEDFADSHDIAMLIDLGLLTSIEFDAEHRAFSIGAAADLGSVYDCLYSQWGVTIPGGTCLGVGMAGHVSGGGFGGLSRRFGAVVDHLYGIEVVVLDASGQARAVLATRDGPNRDLWWGHTGGGGGNFGVITRLLMRAPDSDGSDPRSALPRPPAQMRVGRVSVPVVTMDSFVGFVGNYLRILEDQRDSSSYARLYSTLNAGSLLTTGCEVETYFDADSAGLYEQFVADLTRGVAPTLVHRPHGGPFVPTTLGYCVPRGRAPAYEKFKSAFLRKPFTDDQLRTMFRFLTDPVIVGSGSAIEFFAVGGAINSVTPRATALAERSSIAKLQILGSWSNPDHESATIRWTRDFYRTLYYATGGVPRPDQSNGGCYINYPDTDMVDLEWNPTVPWHELYYQGNYPRLQEIKRKWDPLERFGHALGVKP